MSVIRTNHIRVERFAGVCLAWMAITVASLAQGFSTTTVQGTVYLANGSAGSGTLQISWPAFTTAANQSVAAGRITANIGADGFVSVNLTPNLGASPAGLFYTAVYHMKDGTTSTEYWVVPNAAQASIAQVRSMVMPAAQAAQAVSKAYVDQAIQSVAQGNLTSTGGQLTGPLYLTGDPTQSLQAADKHYVDTSFAQAMPLTGGAASGPLTASKLGGSYQVDQFPGTDFGAKLQACISAIDTTYGGTCDARNFTGMLSMAANLTISAANATVMLPCATVSTANQIVVTAGTRNVSLRGCSLRGASGSSGSQGGTVLMYSGPGAAIQVGDKTYASDSPGFHLENVLINTTASSNSTTQAFAAYRTQELDLQSLYLLGNANQTGMTLDGTGNYTGGTFYDNHISGFQTAIVGVGHQVTNSAATDWLNAGTFVRLHIDCPTNNGNPINGTYGVNLLQGDGNSFTGGDVENCSTALHLGANAQNNTVLGLRNENSTYQVVADPGSSYNSWITGGTMFTGRLVDNGTRNSFLDTFHRAFNSLNGDWYGSQQDSTLTNHYRLGIGSGNERGLLDRYQTDYGYRWTMGLSDAAGGEQFYQVLDELNGVYRISVGQYNDGQASTNNQTVINAAGTGAVVLNGSNKSGTGGVVFGSGGPNETTVATVSNTGNAQFNGTVQVGGTTQSAGTMTVRNNADSEVDYYLWPGLTASQKGSFTYKDYNGNSQWYMVKDANNNWALNSAVGGLDSFKAYQSTNSGDTYINASNSGGAVRVNYESGAGSAFNIYGGSSSNLYAGFSGANSIKFPGLSAASGRNCLQIDSSGYISNTGAACGTGNGSGTVNSGSAGQIANYASNGTAVSGNPATVDGSGNLSTPGTVVAQSVNGLVNATSFAAGSRSGGLIEAYAALPSTGGKITLGANVTISTPQALTLTAGKPLALDQNGFTIRCTNSTGVCLTISPANAARQLFVWKDFSIDGSGAGSGTTGVLIQNGVDLHIGPGHIQNFKASGATALVLNYVEDSTIEVTFEQNYNGAVVTNASNNNRLTFWLNDGGTEYLGTCATSQDVGGVALYVSNGSGDNTFTGLTQSNCGTKTIVLDATAGPVSLNNFSGFDFENNGDGAAGRLFSFVTSPSNPIYGTSIKNSSFNGGPNVTGGYLFDATGTGSVQGLLLENNTGSGINKFTSGFLSLSAGINTINDATGADAYATKTIPYNNTAFYSSPGYSVPGWLLYQTGGAAYLRDTVNGKMALNCNPSASAPPCVFYGSVNAFGGLIVNNGSNMTGNQGNGALVQHSTGTLTNNHLLMADSSGNVADSGVNAASGVVSANGFAATGANGVNAGTGGVQFGAGWMLYQTGSTAYLRDTVNGRMAIACNPNSTAPPCTFYGGGSFVSGSAFGSTQQTSFDANGVKHEQGTAPTVSAGTIIGTNAGGYISGLSAVTSVTVTFANSGWNNWASCTANSTATGSQPYVSSAPGLKTSVTFTFPTSYTGAITYSCNGN